MTIELEPSPVTLEDAQAIREEVASLDVGEPSTDYERELRRGIAYIARRADELERVKRECAALIRQAESELRSAEWVLLPRLRTIAAVLLEGSKRKSIQTPYGKAGFRRTPERLVLIDEEALFAAWSEQQVPGDLISVETRHKFHASALQEHYKQTGEVLPGCEVRGSEETFYVG